MARRYLVFSWFGLASTGLAVVFSFLANHRYRIVADITLLEELKMQ